MTETLTARALPSIVLGSGGKADKQNGLLGSSACHCRLTTAVVCPICFFSGGGGEERVMPSCLWVGRDKSRYSVILLRGFCRRTHVPQDDFILSWSYPL